MSDRGTTRSRYHSARCAGGIVVNFFRGMALGGHLSKMTNWMEAIEHTRLTMPIGAGGGLDSLPLSRQARAIKDLEAGMRAMSKFPRHEVTAQLVRNYRLAQQLGRQTRASAIGNLLEHLVEHDLALNTEDFMKSYG